MVVDAPRLLVLLVAIVELETDDVVDDLPVVELVEEMVLSFRFLVAVEDVVELVVDVSCGV